VYPAIPTEKKRSLFLAADGSRKAIRLGKCSQRIADEVRVKNPFADIKPPGQANEDRQFFVTREAIAKVFDACPNAEWRLIVAFSRFGGLRCPSKDMALEWSNIDWQRKRFLVNSPKTGARWVPIFPELQPYLEEAWELAETGDVHVVTRHRDARQNLRTQLLRIIARAGLESWQKPFHNMRASRETELAAEYPLHVVCTWIGNSALIA
jgi:integrase